MNYKELVYNYTNKTKDEPRTREKGKFYASEVGSIIKGYLKPEDFYKIKTIDKVEPLLSGMSFESTFKAILEYNNINFTHEPRYEIKFDDIIITVKPDFELEDKVIETKFPYKIGTPEEYLERYKHQLELEHQATKKEVILGVFSHPFNINFYHYEPNKKLFKEIKVALKKFNKKL